jgi:hypothetical protein
MNRQIQWSRVLVEGVVIVGSILLAFAIDAWWGALQEATAELDYVERIRADLVETRANIESNAEHYGNLLLHAEAVLPILSGAEPLPGDTLGFLASVLQASRITAPVVARSAYNDLVSTGNLRLIRSDTLRLELSRFYENVGVRLDPVDYTGDQKPYRTAVRSIIPMHVQLLLRERCLVVGEPLACDGGPATEGLGEVARTLVAEPNLVRKLTFSMQAKAVRIGFVLDRAGFSGGFGAVNETIEGLLALLSAEYTS